MFKRLLIALLFPFMLMAQYNVQTLNSTPFMSLQTKHNYQTYFNVTLVGNVLGTNIDFAPIGSRADFNLCQDGTGGRTWSWPGTFVGTGNITVATSALACTQASFITPDGTNWNNAGAGGGGTPGGSNQQVQFNNSGVFAGTPNLLADNVAGDNVAFGASASITATPPFSAPANTGWKYCLDQAIFCTGIASNSEDTLLFSNTTWFSLFSSNSLPGNNATATTPDTTAVISFHSNGQLFMLNCTSSASPAVCGSNLNGSVTIAAGATTEVVNTTGVTANSIILLTEDDSLGTKLGVTCNTTSLGATKISARTSGTSFTITTASAPVTNPACLSFLIMN